MRLNSAPSAAPSAARLLLSYGPSQPHGWPASTPGQVAGMTLGGHTAYEDFTYGGMPYRISLLGFVRPGDAPDPIYHDKPVDPEVAFEQTLSAAFGLPVELHRLGTSVVIATHDINLMNQFDARRLVIEEGRLTIYD